MNDVGKVLKTNTEVDGLNVIKEEAINRFLHPLVISDVVLGCSGDILSSVVGRHFIRVTISTEANRVEV